MIKLGASYVPLYHKYLLQKRTLIGCADLLYPHEYSLTSSCINIKLPAGIKAHSHSLTHSLTCLLTYLLLSMYSLTGRFEDLLLYILANNSLFSCMYSPQNSPISSNGRKLLYIAQNAIAFSLSQILNSALYFAELNNIGASALLDIFVVNPLTISVVCSHSLTYLLTHLLTHLLTQLRVHLL